MRPLNFQKCMMNGIGSQEKESYIFFIGICDPVAKRKYMLGLRQKEKNEKK